MAECKNMLTPMRIGRTLCNVMVLTSPKLTAFVALVALFCIAGLVRADDEQRRAASAPASDPPSGWDLALTGGFVATGLVDPVYALGNVTGQVSRVVVRQTAQESSVNLGVAMFAQVYHDRYAWIAPLSFGIGIRSESRATFFMGSALRFGS